MVSIQIRPPTAHVRAKIHGKPWNLRNLSVFSNCNFDPVYYYRVVGESACGAIMVLKKYKNLFYQLKRHVFEKLYICYDTNSRSVSETLEIPERYVSDRFLKINIVTKFECISRNLHFSVEDSILEMLNKKNN